MKCNRNLLFYDLNFKHKYLYNRIVFNPFIILLKESEGTNILKTNNNKNNSFTIRILCT